MKDFGLKEGEIVVQETIEELSDNKGEEDEQQSAR